MPSAAATRRASSTASLPQQEPNREAVSSPRPQTRMVMPTTLSPASTRRAAATEESTPPLMPTTMRSLTGSVSRAQQCGDALELLGVRVADLDAALSFATDDLHARHQRPLQRLFQRGELRGAPTLLGARGPASRC